MRLLIALCSVVLLQGCFPSFKSTPEQRLYIKEVDSGVVHFAWFFYSTVSSTTPDYITIQKQDKTDTLCIAHNVADLKFDGDKIMIGFYGKPKRYTQEIQLPQTVMNYPVVIDTTYVFKENNQRKFYKKM